MKTIKMSLANIQGKMSRKEMRSIMAGSGSGDCATYTCSPGGVECCYPAYNWCSGGYCKSR